MASTRADADGVIWEHLRRHAERTPNREAIVHYAAETSPRRWLWGDLIAASAKKARWLAAHGVRPGEVCALVVRHHFEFYPLYLGVCAMGAVPAVLAYPNARLHPDKFRQGLQGMSQRSGLDHILAERDLAPIVAPLISGPESTVRSVLHPLEDSLSDVPDAAVPIHPPTHAKDPCLLQHSSGTTGLQKPVVLSHRAVLEHVYRYGEAIGLGPADRVVSWLPLYHDMGLIAAFYLPLVYGIPVVQLSPMEWVSSPALLLQAIHHEKGTLCWLPNFAFKFMGDRVHDDDLNGVRLDTIRMLVNCGEPVRADSHDSFHARFGSRGLRRESLAACYAMAETTFAATQTPLGQEARRLAVDRIELARGKVIPAAGESTPRVCVSSGRPIAGCSLRIVDDQGNDLGPDSVGEIVIDSVSLFDGYRHYPEKTSAVLRDGWYWSGDLGFLHDGECYVIGRKKDLIIVAGNNVYPEDVEYTVGEVPGVIPGRVAAFGSVDETLGTETLCVVAETEVTEEKPRKALRLAIVRAGMAADLTLSRVYLAPPRWVIKSSSGKPARATNQARALAELSAK